MFSKQGYPQSHLVYKHDKDSEELSKLKEKGRVQCTECGRKLTNKQPLETHVRLLHSGECNDCGKKFIVNNTFNRISYICMLKSLKENVN